MKKLKQLIKYINDMKKFLLLLVMVLSLASCTENYSTGAKVGTVSEFTKKGLVWESWDGILYCYPKWIYQNVRASLLRFRQ